MNNYILFKQIIAIIFGLLAVVCQGTDKLVFACNFSNGFTPQVCVRPYKIYNKNTQIINIPEGKALRFGKQSDGSLTRLTYCIKNSAKLAKLKNWELPFPMRFGRMEFRFRPVDWELGEPPFNMLLAITGPLKTNLHITYTRPSTGIPSIQAAYGQNGGDLPGKGQRLSLYPFIALDKSRKWHTVKFEWTPAMLKLTVDGKEEIISTRDIAYPKNKFYGTQLMIGAVTGNMLRGLTDLADLKIYLTLPEANKNVKTAARYPKAPATPMSTPVIDGIISRGEWSNATTLSGFKSLPKGNFSQHQPVVRIGYDKEKLYLAITSDGHDTIPRSRHTTHDTNLWEDDNFELHIDPSPQTPDHFQIIVNHSGAVFDQHLQPATSFDKCRSWNCAGLKTATGHKGKKWTMELAIPFTSLGTKAPQANAEWLFNVCETLPGIGLYSLAGVQHSYGEHEKLGVLRFRDASAPHLVLEDFGNLANGKAEFRFGADPISNGKVEVSAKRYDETAQTEFPLFSEKQQLTSQVRPVFVAGTDKLGKTGVLYVNLFDDGEQIYSGRFRYEISEDAEIEFLRRVVKNNKNFLKVQSAQAATPGYKLNFEIKNSAGNIVRSHIAKVKSMRQKTLIPLANLAKGDYTISFSLLDGNGNKVKTAEARHFAVYGENPPWKACTLGISNQVPPPWIPLEVLEKNGTITVKCWNRIYTFSSRSMFLEQVRSGNTDYLAKPVKLLLTANGITQKLDAIVAQILSHNAKHAQITMTGEAAGWGKIKVTASIDYDGFIWYDLELLPQKAGKINQLAIALELPETASTLLNSGYRNLVNTGYTPKHWNKKLDDMFGPFWIGNESGGLSFGIESAAHWSNHDAGHQATLRRNGGNAHVVLHPVDTDLKIKKRLCYGFYIHPTPVRPRPRPFRTLRSNMYFAHLRDKMAGKGYPENLSWWTATHRYQGYPLWETTPEGIAQWEQRFHVPHRKWNNFNGLPSKNYRTAWYATYSSIARNAPETIWYGETWRAGDQDKLYGDTLYGYYEDMITVCKTNDYINFYLWRYDRTRRKDPKIDGIYFDLMQFPACTRVDHHHGYIGKDGVRHPTWNLREHRKFLERIYTYCKLEANNAPVVVHMSGATARIAGFSFADYYLDGELWSNVLVQARSYKEMKLDQFRAEVLPAIYGPAFIWISQLYRLPAFVPATQRKEWRVEPWAERHMAGLLLLHEIVPDRTSQFDTAYQIWQALDRFGFAENDLMLPYWRHDQGIGGNSDADNTAVTGYLKANEKIMLVVFNNYDTAESVKITLDTRKLFKGSGNIEVRDLEHQKDVYQGKPEFIVNVAKRSFLLLEAKLKK